MRQPGPEGSSGRVVEFPLVRPGMTFYAREKLLEADPSTNSQVSVRFVAEGGKEIGDEQLVGRYVSAS